MDSQFYQNLILLVIASTTLLLMIYLISRIFNIEWAKTLIKGPKREFSSWAGSVSFAAFLLILIVGISNNALIMVNRIFEFIVKPGNPKANTEYLNIQNLIIVAIVWLFLDFIILGIFYKVKQEKNLN